MYVCMYVCMYVEVAQIVKQMYPCIRQRYIVLRYTEKGEAMSNGP